MISIIVIIIFGVAAIINLWSEISNIKWLRFGSKPLLMPMLAMYYWAMSPATDIAILIALSTAFVGDVMLLFPYRKLCFTAGLISFLVCHVCYIFYFVIGIVFTSGFHLFFWIVAAFYALAGILIFSRLAKHLGEMKIPVMVYMSVILAMGTVCTAGCFRIQGAVYWMPFAGAVLFIISDTLLAFHQFRKPIKYGMVYIMSTYIAAQLLLVLGIIAE